MHARYHAQITRQALKQHIEPRAVEVAVTANLGQDALTGMIGHPEFHFDDNAFLQGWAYVQAQHEEIIQALERKDPQAAWKALGRMTHAVQDFYAHSNYVELWLAEWQARNNDQSNPHPEDIDPNDENILASTALRSGRIYILEILFLVPLLRPLALRLLPSDSHAHMNLDGPECGPLFAYALVAAHKATNRRLAELLRSLDDTKLAIISGKSI